MIIAEGSLIPEISLRASLLAASPNLLFVHTTKK